MVDSHTPRKYVAHRKARCAETRNTSFGEVRELTSEFVGPFLDRTTDARCARTQIAGLTSDVWLPTSDSVYAQAMSSLVGLRLPIDWGTFGWPANPRFGKIALATGDPQWAWTDTAPDFGIDAMENPSGHAVDGTTIDHVVLLVPSLDAATTMLGDIGLDPRLKMDVGGRPAAFFRAGPVLEVIESPVRAPSIYGIAVATGEQLETLALRWRAMGVSVGEIKPAIQPGRKIFTVHNLDAGFAVMSEDRAIATS